MKIVAILRTKKEIQHIRTPYQFKSGLWEYVGGARSWCTEAEVLWEHPDYAYYTSPN